MIAGRGPKDVRTVMLGWLGLALALLAFAWPAIVGLRAGDPDDYMRLLEVRDWLAGQGWSDVRQYRMDPPVGADMHWSRLVDLPIAALLWTARWLLAEPMASALAMAVVPLLELLVAMLLLHRLMRALTADARVALTAAMLPLLFPVLLSTFMPMRIDHHGWQAICGLGCMVMLQGRQGPLRAGLVAGLWLTVSLEGLVLVLALTGLMALRWLRRRENALMPFCLGLAASGAVLGLITRGMAGLAVATADQLSWPQLLAFSVAGGLAALLPFAPLCDRAGGRFVALGLIGAAGGGAILQGLGSAALDPFHGLDPVVRQLWLERVREGLPIWRQDWSTALMLAWTPLLVLAGWRLAPRDERWTELALFALIGCMMSLALMRGAVAAQLLSLPFAALLLVRWFPKAAGLATAPARLLAMAACLTLCTPVLASAGGKWLDRRDASQAAPVAATPVRAASGECDLARLASLPRGHLFALLDLGPEILVRTGHSVVAGSYHRNVARLHDVVEAFSGDPAQARTIVRGNRADYVVFCAADDEAHVYAARRPDSVAAGLLAGKVPDWLVPVTGFERGLQVWAVR